MELFLRNNIFERFKYMENNKLLSEDIYNSCVVLDNFCKTNLHLEGIQNISPIVKYIKKQSDKLYVQIAELQND